MNGIQLRQPSRGILGFLLATTLVMLATAPATVQGQTSPTTTGGDRCARPGLSLPLMLVNESRADEASLDVAMREAAAIWATAGLRVVWTTPDVFRERSPYPGVFVVIRTDFAHGRAEVYGASRHGRQVMGRVMSRDGLPTRMIEVSLDAVATSMVDVDHDDGPRSRALVALARNKGPGRALGRVIAHEIGHWLFGREHAPHGLMKATLHPQDLLEAKAPALPSEWNASEADRLRTLPSRCDDVMESSASPGVVPLPQVPGQALGQSTRPHSVDVAANARNSRMMSARRGSTRTAVASSGTAVVAGSRTSSVP